MEHKDLLQEIKLLQQEVSTLKARINKPSIVKRITLGVIDSLSKKNMVVGISISIFITSIALFAAQISKPYTFSAGDPASASQVNENFDTLYTKVNSLDTDVINNASSLNNVSVMVTANETNISANAANISTNITNIANNNTNISTNDTDIATNATNISTNTGDISSIQTYLGGLWLKTGNDLYYTTGSVGVGVTTPESRLQVLTDPVNLTFPGSLTQLFSLRRIDATTQAQAMVFRTGITFDYLIGRLANEDDLVFGVNAGAAFTETVRFETDGDVTVQGCVTHNGGIIGTCTSDARLKKDIYPLDLSKALEKLLQLKPVSYSYKHSKSKNSLIGFLAQDVEKFAPELVSKDTKGYKRVNYEKIKYMMLQSIKELKKENDKLKAANHKLQSKVSEIDALKKRLHVIESSMFLLDSKP